MMKKEVTAIICVVLAVWFFFMGFEIGVYKERSNSSAVEPQTTTVAPVTVAPTAPPVTVAPTEATSAADVSTEPATEESTAPAGTDTTKAEDTTKKKDNAAADPSSMSKEDIINEMAKAFKTVKAEQNCTAVKDESVAINLVDLSVASLKNTVNNIIQNLAEDDHETYTFTNGVATGVDANGKTIEGEHTMDSLLPPTGKEWTVDPAGVKEATAVKNGDAITYTITLVEEQTTFDNAVPQYSSTAFSYLDLTSLDIPVAKITDASMHYPGTQVSVTVDGSGKVTEIHYIMAMDGFGQAKVGPITGDATFEGKDDEKWTFTY